MTNNNAVGSRVLQGFSFAVLLAVFGLAGCGSGGGSTTTTNTSPTTLPTPGGIVLSLVPARSSGVAPLAVFFDASGTTDTGVTTRPFHDLEYTWSFGDPNSGTWAYGAQPGVSSKNSATGPVAAHVFEPVFNVGETSRTYTVTMQAFDGTNMNTTTTTITVTNPDVVFAGDNTICVAQLTTPVAGVGGCPVGALTVMQADFPAIISTYATTGKRVLLKRGDTFISSAPVQIAQNGPMTIGAYGSGAKPYIYKNNQVQLLGFNNGNATISDIRVMDLSFDGANNTGANNGIGQFNNQSGAANILLLRNYFTGFQVSIGFGGEGVNAANNQYGWTNKNVNIFIIENETGYTSNTDYGSYIASINVAMMGNKIDNGGYANNPNGSHVTRWTYINKGVIAHNDLFSAGADRHCIYVVGPTWTGGVPDPTFANGTQYSSAFNGDGITKNIVIADNYLKNVSTDHTGWQIILTPTAGHDMRIQDAILERNLHEFSDQTQVAQVIRANYVTSRNNIAISNAANSWMTFVLIPTPELEPSHQYIWLYNNTMYRSTAGADSGFKFILIQDSAASNISMINNLISAPNSTNSLEYKNDVGASPFTHTNNSSNAQINSTSPTFTNTSPVVASDFKPTCTGSTYPCAKGIPVPVWSDFFRSTEPSPRDLGAVSH